MILAAQGWPKTGLMMSAKLCIMHLHQQQCADDQAVDDEEATYAYAPLYNQMRNPLFCQHATPLAFTTVMA